MQHSAARTLKASSGEMTAANAVAGSPAGVSKCAGSESFLVCGSCSFTQASGCGVQMPMQCIFIIHSCYFSEFIQRL